jgi:hypothetical protein
MATIENLNARFVEAATAEDMERQLNTLLTQVAVVFSALAGSGDGARFVTELMITSPTPPSAPFPVVFCFQGSDDGALAREFAAAKARAVAAYPGATVQNFMLLGGSSEGHSFMGLFGLTPTQPPPP